MCIRDREYAASEREQLLMLNQQIQLQSKNMTSASELYSAQRKKVHDFRAHLNILNRLMKNQEYSAAEDADLTVVTSDNPRDEEPMDIINDILQGVHTVSYTHLDVYKRQVLTLYIR